VLELDPDYRWVMVGEPGLRYLWVLSRTPTLPAGTLESLLARARALGFPVEQMLLTSQSAPAR
jgi:apolipoprotein D and lipocalin family protein